MRTRERLVLAASLILNLILFAVLVLQITKQRQPQPTAVPVAAVQPSATWTQTPAPLPSDTPLPLPTNNPIEINPSPTKAAMAEPSATATVVASPTATPLPASTPTPSPAPVPTGVPGPDWLRYVNHFRTQAGLPQLLENPAWTEGSRLHSIYMINTGSVAHQEDPNSPWYTAAGNTAGVNGNIAISGWSGASELWPIDYWMSAPFHALPMLDPHLSAVGFSFYRDESSSFKMAATMDIKSGLGDLPDSVSFPIFFPKDGGETWVLKYALPEFPDPLSSCPGLQRPVGAPIILQLGSGDLTPRVDSTTLLQGNTPVPHCVIDETRYVGPDGYQQQNGRAILDQRDAVIILPASPMQVGETYTVSIDVSGNNYTWSFRAVETPQ